MRQREIVGSGEYLYTLTRFPAGSSRYGNCEVCDKWADSIYYQTERRKYIKENLVAGWTNQGCSPGQFGHDQCLISRRMP